MPLFYSLALLVLFCIYYVTKVRRSRLHQVVFKYPPCFRELPVLGSAYHFIYGSSEYVMKKFLEMGYNTMKAGGITRLYGLSTHYLVLTDASDIAEALATCQNKDFMYTFLQAITGSGCVFTPEFSKSKVHRRVMMPSFTSRMLLSYIGGMWASSEELTGQLRPHAGEGPFAVGPYLGSYCFNSAFKAADIQEITQELCPLKLLNDFHRCLKLVYDRCSSVWMYPDILYRLTGNYAETKKNLLSFQDYAEKVVKIRKRKLSSMQLLQNDSDHPNKGESLKYRMFDGLLMSELPVQDAKDEIFVMVGASEESGVTAGFALMLLGQYPAVQERLYEELKDIFGDSDRPLDKDDLPRMRYLDMVVKEVLRLYPPVPIIARRAHKEVQLSSGRTIPAGVGIVVPLVGLHRNPKYWGADAEHFDPERFLPERLEDVHGNAYLPFSYGGRSCIGYKFGTYLVKVALCAILRKFKVVGRPASGPVPDITMKFEVTLKSISNFEIELASRT